MAVLAEQDTNENNPLVTDVHDINAEIDDEDVQALIEWTDCLADFDDYQNFWAHLGTAGFPSIEILGERSQSAIHRREDKKRKLGSRVGVIFSGYSILQEKLHDAVRFFDTCTAKTKML